MADEDSTQNPRMGTLSATYSPDDNKLRLYALSRLSPELYARVKEAGFRWAPKQDLFVAPMWTTEREDLLLELCGEIGDEDKSLCDRAEERAERFDQYQENRSADAESARKAVSAIADNIPIAQPILIGHHSERHARRDAERIQNGMRKAVKMWETAKYWEDRARGAIRHAKYKERPDVRARRIKTIEADKRKQERTRAETARFLVIWTKLLEQDSIKKKDGTATTLQERALYLSNMESGGVVLPNGEHYWSAWGALNDGKITPEEIRRQRLEGLPRVIAQCDRWIAHYEHRLTYERALLAEDGGTAADKTGPEAGGACKCWAAPGYGRGWAYIQKVNKVSVTVLDDWGNGGGTFTRTIPFDKLPALMTRAQVEEARAAGRLVEAANKAGFFLREGAPDVETTPKPSAEPKPNAADFEAMRARLREGVKVVTAPQLFPTPADLAGRMVELADILPDMRVLEPSAGTGNIVDAIQRRAAASHGISIEAVEVSLPIAYALSARCKGVQVMPRDFLELTDFELGGRFDRIIMNPPFADAVDIRHILRAVELLKPGGKLVAICANGPRQREQLQPMASHWEDLPAGTFKGTGVSAALLVIEAQS